MIELSAFLIVFFLALCTSIALVPVAVRLSHRFGAMSKPGGRRHEKQPLPRLGGIAIFGGFVVAVIVAQALPVPRLDSYEVIRLAGLLLGGTVIFLFGLLDDIFTFGFFTQAVGQILAAAIAIIFQIFIEFFNNPLTGQQTDPWPHLVTVTLSLFWLGLMMNTVNFLDGLDGLAAGVAFIGGAMLFINSAFRVEPAQLSVSLLPLALMGACLGFLLFNFHPSMIIMGGGAHFLGYTLGALSIIGGAKMATILLVMGLPLMDLVWQAMNRLRQGRNPFQGDRGHLHFRLIDSGRFNQQQVVVAYYVFCALFGLLTLVTGSRMFKFLAFSVMVGLILIGFAIVARYDQGESSTSS